MFGLFNGLFGEGLMADATEMALEMCCWMRWKMTYTRARTIGSFLTTKMKIMIEFYRQIFD